MCGDVRAGGRRAVVRREDDRREPATGAILIILTMAALTGMQLLHVFGVSLDAFMVAGGGALAWMGFAMLSPQPTAMDARPSVNELPKLKQNPVSGLKQIGLEAGASCRGG
ncbi:MAG: MarC family protein [Chthoniobacterales bacterium]